MTLLQLRYFFFYKSALVRPDQRAFWLLLLRQFFPRLFGILRLRQVCFLFPQPIGYEIDDIDHLGRWAEFMVRQNDAELLLGTEDNLDQVDFVHAEVIMQIAAERQGVYCFHKSVFNRSVIPLWLFSGRRPFPPSPIASPLALLRSLAV